MKSTLPVRMQRGSRGIEDGAFRELIVHWPWWVRPVWPLTLLTGLLALLSIVLSERTYDVWLAPKFLTSEYSWALAISIACLFLGLGMTRALGGSQRELSIKFELRQIRYLKRAYAAFFGLTVIGYLLWTGTAIQQGVGLDSLISVLDRELGAISELKSSSRPIGGLTTLTQFGPVAAVLGVILHKLGYIKPTYWFLVGLSLTRVFFYAERLALIEIIIPLVVMSVLVANPGKRKSKVIAFAPILMVPIVWGIFAVSEYTRSWVYYQDLTDFSFTKWVSLRLVGYYTTSFNHSALFADAYNHAPVPPYFSLRVLWEAPVIGSYMQHPGINGIEASQWWSHTLYMNSNPEFNNPGSFLVTYAEYGILLTCLIWVAVGVSLGVVFSRLTKGSLPALLAFPCLYVGLLELPRFIYWTEGRAFPSLLGLTILALTYPRKSLQQKESRT